MNTNFCPRCGKPLNYKGLCDNHSCKIAQQGRVDNSINRHVSHCPKCGRGLSNGVCTSCNVAYGDKGMSNFGGPEELIYDTLQNAEVAVTNALVDQAFKQFDKAAAVVNERATSGWDKWCIWTFFLSLFVPIIMPIVCIFCGFKSYGAWKKDKREGIKRGDGKIGGTIMFMVLAVLVFIGQLIILPIIAIWFIAGMLG